MTEPAGRLAWIAIAPVKSMARVFVERAELGLDGIPGDRVFAVVDQRGQLVNGKRAGRLATVAVEHDPTAGTLTMRFPDGTVVGGRPGVGEPAVVRAVGNVGRCAVTTQDPDTGRPTFDTLHVLNRSRGHLPSTEPLPFGVWAEVVTAGEVRVHDPAEVLS